MDEVEDTKMPSVGDEEDCSSDESDDGSFLLQAFGCSETTAECISGIYANKSDIVPAGKCARGTMRKVSQNSERRRRIKDVEKRSVQRRRKCKQRFNMSGLCFVPSNQHQKGREEGKNRNQPDRRRRGKRQKISKQKTV